MKDELLKRVYRATVRTSWAGSGFTGIRVYRTTRPECLSRHPFNLDFSARNVYRTTRFRVYLTTKNQVSILENPQ